MEKRSWRLAIGEFTKVTVVETPNHVAAEAHKQIGVCHLKLGEAGFADNHLQRASQLQAKDAEIQDLSLMAKTNPSAGLDRGVAAENLKESDRPMWEAFERSRPGTTPQPTAETTETTPPPTPQPQPQPQPTPQGR
jgi:hypothetical protein